MKGAKTNQMILGPCFLLLAIALATYSAINQPRYETTECQF